MRPAIIAFGIGYRFDDIKYFLYSCRLHAPDTDLYIFAGQNAAHLKNACSEFPRVHIIAHREPWAPKLLARVFMKFAPSLYLTLLQLPALRLVVGKKFVRVMKQPLFHFMSKRFFVINEFIKKLPNTHIMISDLRDVVLQGDPFKEFKNIDLVTGEEPTLIADCQYNKKWLEKTYPENFNLLQKKVLCAGVTYGTREAIENYLEYMVLESEKQMKGIVQMLGADQAIHNRLFYELLPKLRKEFSINGTGPIATLHFSTLTEFNERNGYLYHLDGFLPPVIHQYDRHPEVMAKIRKRIREMTSDVPVVNY